MSMINDESLVVHQQIEHQILQATEDPDNPLHVLPIGNQLHNKELCNYDLMMRSHASLCEAGRRN